MSNPSQAAGSLLEKAERFAKGKASATKFVKMLTTSQILKSANLTPKGAHARMQKNQFEVLELLNKLEEDKKARDRAVIFIRQLLSGEKTAAQIKAKVGTNTKLAQEF